ncbi:MAG TPA: GAF domain-containing sensor histidine kinase [Gaiellales bacterium]|jgi:signal transduction histidine kinase
MTRPPRDAALAEPAGAALRAVGEAVTAMAAAPSLETTLHALVQAARRLASCRYAAVGVPDGGGGFSHFITDGMSDQLIAAIGPLPRTHGLLGAMLERPVPHRTDDISRDPRFEWWPAAHPRMRSFLGVPIVSGGDVAGAFYLTEKIGADEFSDADQELIELFAAHAAVAIATASAHERSRELGVVEERNRLARDLHDAVSQTLFSLTLTAEAAAELLDRDPAAARARLDEVRRLAAEARAEMRSLVFQLRPADLEADGLVATLRKHVEVLGRVHPTRVEMHVHGDALPAASAQRELYRIAQEALQNALKHSGAGTIRLDLELGPQAAVLTVTDDGAGFDPADPIVRSQHLGLTVMDERARAVHGRLELRSRPGAGTTVRVEVPHG